ncbi:pyridoxamine 5'-phosphate oxidase family protein [Balneatrix alpica]|uniref:Pyridoxamine 5'-phosphate oxidase family protein n=1 Tax=Balneatrix alpica TaxID=75684 RepID=A0ABV5Z8L4_9GAMM|nr:pyridoxamine 5'-phosphate oxidase family protein [Balneatrix alpica]
MSSPDEQQLLAMFDQQLAFRKKMKTLMLATLGSDQEAEVSYAPYVEQQGYFYIYISELAAHTGNLLRHPQLKVMLIEDESSAKQPHARERLSFKAQATEVQRETQEWQQVQAAFSERFGEIAQMLAGLADFHLFRLSLSEGLYVKGFAKAYRIHADGIEHLRDLGHRSQS